MPIIVLVMLYAIAMYIKLRCVNLFSVFVVFEWSDSQ